MMDKSCHSSGESTNTNTAPTGNKDQYLMHLNKLSHKISKPPIRKPTFDHHHHQPPAPPPPPQDLQQQQHQHQPPVYNINKSDFREVVQKLTGSPAHERFSTPPPIHPPKPQSSRLQRIRPPPLAQLTNRPPPLLNNALPPQQPPPLNATLNPSNPTAIATGGNFNNGQRQVQPLSPLPPFPAVHAAAESPISAYMRFLQNSTATFDSDSSKRLSGFSPLAPLVSPRWSNFAEHQQQPLPPPPQHNLLPSPTSASMGQLQFPMASSPLPFGCMPSPRSPYPLLFSPTNQFGFQQFPLSPTLPVPSPTWRGH